MDMKPDGQQHISFIDSIKITKKDLQTPEDKKKKKITKLQSLDLPHPFY